MSGKVFLFHMDTPLNLEICTDIDGIIFVLQWVGII